MKKNTSETTGEIADGEASEANISHATTAAHALYYKASLHIAVC